MTDQGHMPKKNRSGNPNPCQKPLLDPSQKKTPVKIYPRPKALHHVSGLLELARMGLTTKPGQNFKATGDFLNYICDEKIHFQFGEYCIIFSVNFFLHLPQSVTI